ncbi:MAG: HEAT repeat domain-containing protein [Gemmatimonadales bacterium]
MAATCRIPEVSPRCSGSLARVGQTEHLAVVRRLLVHPEEMVRVSAFQALAALAGDDDLLLLRSGMADPSVWVAEHAARGLAAGPGRGLLAAIADTHAPRSRLAREVLIEGAA